MLKNSKWRSRVIVDSALCYIERLWFYTTYTRVCQRNLKPWPNGRNTPTQHIATLLGATCCVRLATLLRCVAICWVLLAQIWPVSNLSQQHPTCCNTSQHGGQKHATCCAQQCCDMLRWLVAIVWPGPYTKKLKTTFEQLHSGFWGNFWATFRVLEQHFEKIGEALVLTKRVRCLGKRMRLLTIPTWRTTISWWLQRLTKATNFRYVVYNCDNQSCLHIFLRCSNMWSFIYSFVSFIIYGPHRILLTNLLMTQLPHVPVGLIA